MINLWYLGYLCTVFEERHRASWIDREGCENAHVTCSSPFRGSHMTVSWQIRESREMDLSRLVICWAIPQRQLQKETGQLRRMERIVHTQNPGSVNRRTGGRTASRGYFEQTLKLHGLASAGCLYGFLSMFLVGIGHAREQHGERRAVVAVLQVEREYGFGLWMLFRSSSSVGVQGPPICWFSCGTTLSRLWQVSVPVASCSSGSQLPKGLALCRMNWLKFDN